MSALATLKYQEIQQKIAEFDERELSEIINFIDALTSQKSQKQRRAALFAELRAKNVAERYGDALTWQQALRQDNP